jgi:hypothetical protein
MASSASDPAVEPIEQLLDLFLYAPIGLMAKGTDAFPELVERGRTQATNARVIGQFALGASNTKARKSIADAEQHLQAFFKIILESARPSAKKSTSVHDARVADATPESSATDFESIEDLVPNYDGLTAAQVLPLLVGKSSEDLDRIEGYEQARRSRKTVLNRIRQLRN